MTNQGVDETEDQQTLDKPHVPNLQFTSKDADDGTHKEQRNTQAVQFLLDKLFGTLLVKTPRHEISGDEEIKPHEECGVGREEMPDPRHKFCWIGWCV